MIVDELARCKASLLHQRDDTNHHIRLLLHERQVLFGLMSKNQEVLLRLKNAFDPLSISTPKDLDSDAINALNEVEKISLLGLAELNLNTGNVLNERLLGSKKCVPKGITEKSKYMDDNKQQLDTPAEEGLRQVCTFGQYICNKQDQICSNTYFSPLTLIILLYIDRLCLR